MYMPSKSAKTYYKQYYSYTVVVDIAKLTYDKNLESHWKSPFIL